MAFEEAAKELATKSIEFQEAFIIEELKSHLDFDGKNFPKSD